jgi:hypothetical protein
VTFLEGIDIVESDVFDANLSSIFLKSGHLFIGAAFVVEHQVPRKVLVLGGVRV